MQNPKSPSEKSVDEIVIDIIDSCGNYKGSYEVEFKTLAKELVSKFGIALTEERRLMEEAEKNLKLTREILACVHSDGGHYTEDNGYEKSTQDGISIIYRTKERAEKAEAIREEANEPQVTPIQSTKA